MTIEDVISQYGIWAVIVYLVIKDALPTLSSLITNLAGVVVPARFREKEKLVDIQIEQERQRSILREREVIAMEQIGKMLATMDVRMQNQESKIDLLTASLVTANQALSVVLDRINRRREDFDAGNK